MRIWRTQQSIARQAEDFLEMNEDCDLVDIFKAGYELAKADYEKAKKKEEEEARLPQVIDSDPLAPKFETWWKAYANKHDRAKCEALWSKLTTPEKIACMAHTPLYVASTPDLQYRRYPEKYLRNKTWNNQIPKRDGNANEQERDFFTEKADTFARLNSMRKPNS